jgi:hypothetical protein
MDIFMIKRGHDKRDDLSSPGPSKVPSGYSFNDMHGITVHTAPRGLYISPVFPLVFLKNDR